MINPASVHGTKKSAKKLQVECSRCYLLAWFQGVQGRIHFRDRWHLAVQLDVFRIFSSYVIHRFLNIQICSQIWWMNCRCLIHFVEYCDLSLMIDLPMIWLLECRLSSNWKDFEHGRVGQRDTTETQTLVDRITKIIT